MDKFTYLESSVSSGEKDVNIRLAKVWTAVNRQSVIGKLDLTNKIECSFFQVAVVSILLYGCTKWTLGKHVEKNLDGNYTRLLKAILNKCYVLTFDPAQKMLFQGDAPEGSDTFQWPVIERDCMGGLRLIIWDKVKVPLCQYRLMHRKRVTSELHDSYFRLMTIKHSISKIQWAIVWALNYYLTQLSSSPRSSC